MIILICGAEGSGKTVLAKPFAELINAVYVNKDTYPRKELKGYIDGLVAAGKTVVVDKRCQSVEAHNYINPDYVVWMDTVEAKTETPPRIDYHVSEWFNDTHKQLVNVIKLYMERNNA
jgi:uridine kinase